MPGISGGGRVVRVAETPRTAAIAIGSPALTAELRRAETLEKTSVNLYNSQLAKARAGQISLPALAASIEKEIVVPWDQQYERLRALDLHGPPDWTRKPVAEFMRRRLDAWRLTARAARERNPLLMKEAVAAQQDAIATLRDTTTTVSTTRDGKMGNRRPEQP
jgi:hypothetical protein